MAASATSSPVWTYPFSHNDSSNPNATIHNTTLLADASGVGAKNWTFITQNTGSPWQVGLLAELDHLSNAAGSQTYEKDLFTWAQDNAGHTDPGNPYITSKTVVMDPGQSYQQSELSTQTEDPYGNVLDVGAVRLQQHVHAAANVYEHVPELDGVCGALHLQPAAHVKAERRQPNAGYQFLRQCQ